MSLRYDDVIASLRGVYDGAAAERDAYTKEPWKLKERQEFLARLSPGARLLEIGAGTGQDSEFFASNGLSITATDLSPVHVQLCQAKGLDAHVMDFMHLDFPASSFDAVWALNCLLHVPNADLPTVLTSVRDLMKPGGLFFIGVYGGEFFEGIAEWDRFDPKRFFSLRTDEQLLGFLSPLYEVVDFHPVNEGEHRVQTVTLRRR